MEILDPLFANVIEKLLDSSTEFMLIGGYAVNYYGFARYTGDIDLWLRPTDDNKANFIKALRILQRHPDDIAIIETLDFTTPQTVNIGSPPLRIDFLTKINLVEFDEAWAQKQFFTLNNRQVPVINYNHLILSKFNTGRSKDKIDLEELQRIRKINNLE